MAEADEYAWLPTMMLTVAVCERVALLAEEDEQNDAPSPLRTALGAQALHLRDLASAEIARRRAAGTG
jgi:hypothetical protein